MQSPPWKHPGFWAAVLLVAVISYHLARQEPESAAAPGGTAEGGITAPASFSDDLDEAEPTQIAKLRDRASSGDSAGQIAKDVKRALGYQIEFFTPDGRINRYLMETAGIPERRMPVVQRVFDETMKSASASLKARMVLDDDKTDPANRIHTYHIPADPVEAERLLAEFKQALVAACGETAAAILLEIYEPDHRFGGFGRYDIAVETQPQQGVRSHPGRPDEYFETDALYYSFVCTEPDTGTQVRSLSCVEGHEATKENFGTLLEPPPWK